MKAAELQAVVETRCAHCGAVPPPHELAEGWCDSCGKRLPESVRLSVKKATAPVPAPVEIDEPSLRRTNLMLWGLVAFLLFGFGALFFAATAGAG